MIALYAIVAVWALWVAYVAIMHLRRVEERWGLTRAQKVMASPLVVFVVLDVLLNWLAGVIFWDRPERWSATFSKRLYRYRYDPEWEGTWHRAVARGLQEELLADFDDTGSHGDPGR